MTTRWTDGDDALDRRRRHTGLTLTIHRTDTTTVGPAEARAMLEVGTEAPTFELLNQHGESVSLESFSGQPVIVYFYPRANTEGCTIEACEFRDARPHLDDHEAVVLGISDDPVEDLAEFADDYDLDFHLLSDEDGSVSEAYDSYGEKQMFGNTFDGVFRNTYVVGPDGTITAAYEGVSPEGHAENVLEEL